MANQTAAQKKKAEAEAKKKVEAEAKAAAEEKATEEAADTDPPEPTLSPSPEVGKAKLLADIKVAFDELAEEHPEITYDEVVQAARDSALPAE